MQRKKAPAKKKLLEKKEKIEFIIESLSHGWLPEERETSILFSHNEKAVYLETSYPSTARRWFKMLWGVNDIVWDTKGDVLKLKMPWDYCRKADLIIKPEFR